VPKRKLLNKSSEQGRFIWTAERLDGADKGSEGKLPQDQFEDPYDIRLVDGATVEHNPETKKWRYCAEATTPDTPNYTNPFLPPYNFVSLPNKIAREPWVNLLERGGHERFNEFCGQITCELEVLTPLFIPDAEGQSFFSMDPNDPQKGHRQKKFFRVAGVPAIPPASLKGPMRSVFEALTNSCLGIYEKDVHRIKMGWRRASDHPDRKPARLYRLNNEVKYQIFKKQARISYEAVNALRLSDGDCVTSLTTVQLRHHGPPEAIEVTNASGSKWSVTRPACLPTAAGELDVRGNGHRQQWSIVIGRERFRLPVTLVGLISGIKAGGSVKVTQAVLLPTQSPGGFSAGRIGLLYNSMDRFHKRYAIEVEYAGKVYALPTPTVCPTDAVAHITSPGDANKSNDRVFWDLDPAVHLVGNEAYLACIGAHDSSDPPLAKRPLWSKMSDPKGGDVPLNEGPLVYIAMNRYRSIGTPPGGIFLGPVAMYREPYDKTVDDAIPDSHKPGECSLANGLCPACALFGGLFPDQPGRNADNPLAGRVSMNTAWLVGEHETKDVPLRILGKPRPSYFPFYLKPRDNQPVDYNGVPWECQQLSGNQSPKRPSRPQDPQADFWNNSPSVHIRGRKFYWHQPARQETAGDDWWRPYQLEDAQQGELPEEHREQRRSSQNATVELLKPGAKFKFTVDFENLSETELKLLVWCLNLEGGMAHHFGMGKPIGLGSAKVTVKGVTTRCLQTSYTRLLENDESNWTTFDPDDPAKLVTAGVDQNALEELRKILALKPFGDNPPHIDYIPQNGLAANKGFNYYMYHRHKPLVTIGDAIRGFRMDADNLP
jgi:CRISPR/Cas system CSM-associated protein Csm3 (group 7 of RAMP superfamily)